MSTVKILKFSKPSCNPCKILSAYLREIDLEANEAVIEEIDIEEQPEVIEQYNLSGVPTLIFTRNGVEMGRMSGLHSVEEIEEMITHSREGK
jgi:thioredoxin 1